MASVDHTVAMPALGSAAAPGVVAARLRVALVCMPCASASQPSLQLGLLGAVAEAAGFGVDLLHFNLNLAALLGPAVYEPLCQQRTPLLGEWLFSPAAFGADAPGDEAAYLREFPDTLASLQAIGKDAAYLAALRQHILPDFVQERLEAVDWGQYAAVGFSALFQQNVASLALARRIKQRYPQVALVFGGANMEGDMGREFARAFACVDYVVCGEADETFPTLLRALARPERPVPRMAGVVARVGTELVDGGAAPPVWHLDALPTPNYAPYFAQARALGLEAYYASTWSLPFESARGCWWGQTHHCTYCGINHSGMAYRAKQAPRVLAELGELARRHRICSFMAVDNILDLDYVHGLFAPIARARLDYRFFYQARANLTREQIAALYQGGVRRIQPGMESMSSHVMRLTRKGSTMLQNVRCLKWCAYYGVGVSWSLLWGFPGETDQDYVREMEVLRHITHLEPPQDCARVWLERFSPHYVDPAFPVTQMRPQASYAHIYPAGVDLTRAAYFFDYQMGDTADPAVHAATVAHVKAWKADWAGCHKPRLCYRRIQDAVLIDFDYGPQRAGTYRVSGTNAEIYHFCAETMRSPAQVLDYLADLSDEQACTLQEVRDALETFCSAGLMLGEDDKYLGLALPTNPNW